MFFSFLSDNIKYNKSQSYKNTLKKLKAKQFEQMYLHCPMCISWFKKLEILRGHIARVSNDRNKKPSTKHVSIKLNIKVILSEL